MSLSADDRSSIRCRIFQNVQLFRVRIHHDQPHHLRTERECAPMGGLERTDRLSCCFGPVSPRAVQASPWAAMSTSTLARPPRMHACERLLADYSKCSLLWTLARSAVGIMMRESRRSKINFDVIYVWASMWMPTHLPRNVTPLPESGPFWCRRRRFSRAAAN